MSVKLRAAADELASRTNVMRKLVKQFGYPKWPAKPKADRRFETLAKTICYQQLAGKAAATIWSRTVARIGGTVTPRAFLKFSPDELRQAGLSKNKALSMLDLSVCVLDGRVNLASAGRRMEETVIDELVQVRGIGKWTAEMFLISALHRMDVWSVGDLGIRRGYGLALGWKEMPTAAELGPLGDPFRPYRSVASHYFWRVADTASGS